MTKGEDYYTKKAYFGHEDRSIETLDDPLIIQVAPTGSFLTRDVNPNQPYVPEEIADNVKRACAAGASMCHLHVRGEDGIPDQRPETIARTVDMIREEHDPVMSMNVRSNIGGAFYGRQLLEETIGRLIEERGEGYMDMITSSVVGQASSEETPFVVNADVLREWIEYLRDHDLKPEMQLYAYEGIDNVDRWAVKQGILETPYYMNVVVGNHAYFKSGPTSPYGAAANFLESVKRSVPFPEEDVVLGAIAGGRNWLPLTATAVLQGYDVVRIGMEDSAMLYPHRDELIEHCGQVVERVATIARSVGREVATPDQAREILDL